MIAVFSESEMKLTKCGTNDFLLAACFLVAKWHVWAAFLAVIDVEIAGIACLLEGSLSSAGEC